MAKKVTALIKLQVNAGKATPAPPIGPALGQHGVNIAGQEGQRLVIHFIPALLQSAVHQDALSVDFQTVAAAGDTLSRAEKAELHTHYLLS